MFLDLNSKIDLLNNKIGSLNNKIGTLNNKIDLQVLHFKNEENHQYLIDNSHIYTQRLTINFYNYYLKLKKEIREIKTKILEMNIQITGLSDIFIFFHTSEEINVLRKYINLILRNEIEEKVEKLKIANIKFYNNLKVLKMYEENKNKNKKLEYDEIKIYTTFFIFMDESGENSDIYNIVLDFLFYIKENCNSNFHLLDTTKKYYNINKDYNELLNNEYDSNNIPNLTKIFKMWKESFKTDEIKKEIGINSKTNEIKYINNNGSYNIKYLKDSKLYKKFVNTNKVEKIGLKDLIKFIQDLSKFEMTEYFGEDKEIDYKKIKKYVVKE